MSAKGKLSLLLVVLLLVGGCLGFIGGFYYNKYKMQRRWAKMTSMSPKTMQLDAFTRELKLSPEQRQSIEAILDKQFIEYRAIWKETKPRYDAIGDSARIAIVSLLSPEQQVKYDSLIARWKRMFKSMSKSDE